MGTAAYFLDKSVSLLAFPVVLCSAVLTASLTSLLLYPLLSLLVGMAESLAVNPDNIMTPLASGFAALASTILLPTISTTLNGKPVFRKFLGARFLPINTQ